jgi:hypothetical protein
MPLEEAMYLHFQIYIFFANVHVDFYIMKIGSAFVKLKTNIELYSATERTLILHGSTGNPMQILFSDSQPQRFSLTSYIN